MFDRHLGHREICHIGRGERRADASGSGGYQTVSLVKSNAAFSELTAPRPRLDALNQTERSKPKSIEKAAYRRLLRGAQPSPDLLDGDHAHPRLGPYPTESGDPPRRWSTPKGID
jgi:hypothetical protein